MVVPVRMRQRNKGARRRFEGEEARKLRVQTDAARQQVGGNPEILPPHIGKNV